MEWQEKPTEPGWWWVRGLPKIQAPTIAYVTFMRSEPFVQVALPDELREGPVAKMVDARWFGPLPTPEKLIEREEALGFYADEENWRTSMGMVYDRGAKARAALGD